MAFSPSNRWVFPLGVLLLVVCSVDSVNILCLTPPLAGRGSHLALMTTLCNSLSNGGHNTTLLIQGPGKPSTTNINVIRHPSAFSEENIEDYAEKFTLKSLSGDFGLFDLFGFINRLATDCELWMSNDLMFQQMQENKFTIAIVDHFYFCGVLYAHRLGVPLIILDVASYFSILDSEPIPLSYVPMYNSELTNQMNFWHRTINLIAYCGSMVMLQVFRKPFLEISRKYNITDNISENRLFNDVELWLLNSDFTLEFPRPVLPNMVYVGGYIATEPKPLSEPFSSLVDTHDGTIVVSFGTSFYSYLIPSLEKSLIDTFSQFNQLIIWKQNVSLDTSGNVHTFDWVPQNSLVGHPKTKLLVSHCGMNSIMEAIYHGVPVVCIPFQGDQIDNAVRVKSKGLGLTVPPKSLTTERLKIAIQTVLSGDRFKDKAVQLSMMFHHQPQKPMERAIFAINHTIKFLRQGDKIQISELGLLQYYMIDSLAFLCLIFTFLLLGLIFTTAYFLKMTSYFAKYFTKRLLDKHSVGKMENKKMQ